MGLELWWLGQAGFRLRDPNGGPVVFVDPFLTRRDDRTWQAPLDPTELATADFVLASHEHTDHLDRPALAAAAAAPNSRFTLVVPRPIVDDALRTTGLPHARIISAQPDELIEHQGVRIYPVPARHGVDVADSYNFGEQLSNGQVRYLGFVVEGGGAEGHRPVAEGAQLDGGLPVGVREGVGPGGLPDPGQQAPADGQTGPAAEDDPFVPTAAMLAGAGKTALAKAAGEAPACGPIK